MPFVEFTYLTFTAFLNLFAQLLLITLLRLLAEFGEHKQRALNGKHKAQTLPRNFVGFRCSAQVRILNTTKQARND